MCALHTGLHLASLTKTETVCMPCTNKTTANFCNFSSPYSRHPWANVPHRQEGTSANIIITQTIIRLYPYSHCLDITKKTPKCQNYPLTCIVMKISAISLSALLGPPTPKLPRFVPAVCYTLSQNLMPNVGENGVITARFLFPHLLSLPAKLSPSKCLKLVDK